MKKSDILKQIDLLKLEIDALKKAHNNGRSKKLLKMSFMKTRVIFTGICIVLLTSVFLYSDQVTKQYTFTDGEIISAEQVNKNFDDLFSNIEDLAPVAFSGSYNDLTDIPASFVTDSGYISAPYDEPVAVTLSFGVRSVYLVKASWGGRNSEGTRAWWVLTPNVCNSYTGYPAIIEIGMTSGGSYNHSDNLVLHENTGLSYDQLELYITNLYYSALGPSIVYWSVTRFGYN